MKRIILKLILISGLVVGQANAGFFQEEDKQMHMMVSVPFGAMGGLVCRGDRAFNLRGWEAIACGTALGMLPGFGKEYLDSRQEGNKWDNRDLGANLIGAFVGAIGTVTVFRFSSGSW